LLNNIVYAVGTTALSIIFGVGISLLLNREFKGRGIATTLVIYPYLIPTVVVALAFEWIFHDLFGIVNSFLLWTGVIESTIAWFSEFAMASVIAVSVWKFTPFIVILCLARLQTIPDHLYEAAKIEGAGLWQQFRYVTLPQLRMVLFIAIMLRFVWIFNMFDIIWLLTGGGPVNQTEHLPILIYKTMFRSYEVGYASAIAMVVLVMLVGFLVTYFRLYAPTKNGGESA
jgi:multiple sugar transport system permease protein